MYVYDIKLHFKSTDNDYSYALTTYLCELSGNNQIVFETLNISGTEDDRVARVSVPYKDSLDEKHLSAGGREALERLAQYLREPMSVEYVGEDHTYEDCFADGTESDCYVLHSHYELRDVSPICCGTTRGYIPYYLLPPLSEEVLSELTAWETNYAAYDKLFYVTGIGEMSAHKMLSGIKSPLTQKGMSVCHKLEKTLGKPVYYYLYRFYGKHSKRCPLCGGDWIQTADSAYAYKCEACRIVADKTHNEY